MVGITLRSKVGEKGQVVIPKPIRDQFGISPMSELVFSVDGDKILIEKMSGEEWFKKFTSGVKRVKLPKNIDWDEIHYSQFE